ncbi:MAG TPA: helix-turn-helix transcriptional regulator [Spirochaetota bacterium]|nr:helix-turn-helix transcriptional regulator [Spirochaetota bacterium]HQH31467.1 helix-turn-helix transcriptional regulator [Spirochaetota bacterium]HRU45109.1 helix-turn-helix transcriptional regulator [Spirochaetota bacterium]
MKTHKNILAKKLTNSSFKEKYNEEKRLIEISLELQHTREKLGLTQTEVAKKAKITQQQLSKIENGGNFNILTFIKVCKALNLDFDFINLNKKQVV